MAKLAFLGMVFLAGCGLDTSGQLGLMTSEAELIPAGACGATTFNLTAGQTIHVGSVTVSNDASNLYVTYSLDYLGATFGTLHLWVGNDLLNVPANKNGTPIPGQFCSALGGACADATNLVSYTFTIPFASLSIVDVNQVCGTILNIVAHAEVNADTNGDGTVDHETAFAGPNAGSGPRWWFYGKYSICCDFGPPTPPVCTTSFAKGGWIWTTDRKSNPENLPSLNLTKNRWGWAINLLAPGQSSYPIWAGAGLNDTSRGTRVGTLNVSWDGASVTATYSLLPGFSLEEVHVYAGDSRPSTIAPGQYGFVAEFDPSTASYTFQGPLADTDGVGGVWLVAHAVTCR